MARKALIQVRRDSAADWTSADPTLAEGEPGFETDTGILKIGDGSSTWGSLGIFPQYLQSPTNIRGGEFGACIYVDPSNGDTYIGSNFYHDGSEFRSITGGYAKSIKMDISTGNIINYVSNYCNECGVLISWSSTAQTIYGGIIVANNKFIGHLNEKNILSDVSDTELNADTPAAAITATTYTQIYSQTIPSAFQTTTNGLRIKWTIANVTGDTCKSKVYVNDVAVGAEKTGAGDFSEDITNIKAGDTVEIYAYVTDGDESTLTAVSQCGTLSAVIEAVNPTW